MTPVEMMRQLDYVREITQNKGLRVNGIQVWSGGKSGDSWCCELWWMCNDIAYKGKFVLSRVQSCQDVYEYAKRNNLLVNDPKFGDTFLYVDDNDHAHHIGLVTTDGGLTGIAGNTSADGTSDNGDRVAEHGLITNKKHIKYVRFK